MHPEQITAQVSPSPSVPIDKRADSMPHNRDVDPDVVPSVSRRIRSSSATAGILSSFSGAVSTGGESKQGGPDLGGMGSAGSKEPPYHWKMGAVAMCCVQ